MIVATAKTNERLLLSAAELAERLGVSERHVWAMHSSGRLPMPVRLGRCRRWKVADIDAWLADGCPTRA